jgi:hypothetical protein
MLGLFGDLVESTLLAGGGKKENKNRNLGDSARGRADPGSAAVYTMDRPDRVICTYVCVGTVYHPLGPTDSPVVATGAVRYCRSAYIM